MGILIRLIVQAGVQKSVRGKEHGNQVSGLIYMKGKLVNELREIAKKRLEESPEG